MKYTKLFEEFINEENVTGLSQVSQSSLNKEYVTTKEAPDIFSKYLPKGTILNSFSLQEESDYADVGAPKAKHYWINKNKKIYISIGSTLTDDDLYQISIMDGEDEIPYYEDKMPKNLKKALDDFINLVGLVLN